MTLSQRSMALAAYWKMASSSTRRHHPHFIAAKILTNVLQGQPLESALYEHQKSDDIALLTFLCYTTMRHYYSLHEKLSEISHRPIDRMDLEVKSLLLLGACQLQYSSLPGPLAVAHTVTAAKKLGKTSAGALINAVLRRFETTRQPQLEEARYELPRWMIDRIKSDYPAEAESIFRANLCRAPMTLRINIGKISTDDYCNLLVDRDIQFQKTSIDHAITLAKPRSQSELPGFEEGYFCVQDLASQLPVRLLEPECGDRILDACAAPGIKARQISDSFPFNPVDAFDIKPRCSTWNIPSIEGNGKNVVLQQGDLTTTSWWDGIPYQRILLDVPCSGSGTLRRHPDIKVTRREVDVRNAAELQLNLLKNLWTVLSNNGFLVYSTCSIFYEENDLVIEQFLTDHDDVSITPFKFPIGRLTRFGWQTLPSEQAHDGFYFARLKKVGGSA